MILTSFYTNLGKYVERTIELNTSESSALVKTYFQDCIFIRRRKNRRVNNNGFGSEWMLFCL